MENGQALYDLIKTVLCISPVFVLIWKHGKQSQKIEEHETRIKKLETGQETISELKGDIKEIKTSIQFIREAVNEKSTNTGK